MRFKKNTMSCVLCLLFHWYVCVRKMQQQHPLWGRFSPHHWPGSFQAGPIWSQHQHRHHHHHHHLHNFQFRRTAPSLKIPLKHIQLRVRVIGDRGRVGQHPEVHQRLVHVLGQKHYPHIQDDVLHQKGIVEDQDVHKEQAQIKHIWELVQQRFYRI